MKNAVVWKWTGCMAVAAMLCITLSLGRDFAEAQQAQPAPQPSAPAVQKGQAAQTAKPTEGKKYAVVIEHKGVDDLGLRLIYNMRERFNTSSFFRLTNAKEKKLRIRVVTQEEFKDRPAIGSIYTAIWLYSESDDVLSYYLDSETGIVSDQNMADMAERMAARTQNVTAQFGYLFE